jgi:hypothetical protein
LAGFGPTDSAEDRSNHSAGAVLRFSRFLSKAVSDSNPRLDSTWDAFGARCHNEERHKSGPAPIANGMRDSRNPWGGWGGGWVFLRVHGTVCFQELFGIRGNMFCVSVGLMSAREGLYLQRLQN